MADLYCLYRRVTLKIRSRSPKSDQLLPPLQQCIYASLVKIPPLAQSIAQGNLILDISECRCDLENEVKVTKILSTLPLLPTVHLCEFGQNPSTGSEDNTWKPYFGHFSAAVTLKIRSRSSMQVWSNSIH